MRDWLRSSSFRCPRQQFESAEITAQLIEPSDAPLSPATCSNALGRLGRFDYRRGSIQVNRQAKWWLDVEIEARDLFERALEDGAAARFQGDDKRQGRMRDSRAFAARRQCRCRGAKALSRPRRRCPGGHEPQDADSEARYTRRSRCREPARAVRERPRPRTRRPGQSSADRKPPRPRWDPHPLRSRKAGFGRQTAPVATTRFLLPWTCATSEDRGTSAGCTDAERRTPSLALADGD